MCSRAPFGAKRVGRGWPTWLPWPGQSATGVEDAKDKSWWGEGYAGVCQKPYQFSCWNKNHPNYRFLRGARQIPFRELAQCRIAADQVIDGKVPDPTGALPTVTPVR